MKLTDRQIDFITENENIFFATADADGWPRAIPVVPSVIEADRIIISDMQMKTTSENVKANQKVFIYSTDKEMRNFMKISGAAEYVSGGDLFDSVRELESKRCELAPRGIIIVKIKDAIQGSEE
jgi:uncharacterized pyridoxamine 5'-phosphate oxidase family protein